MTDQQGKEIILNIARKAAAAGDLDRAAKLELAAEYLTNSKFRQAVRDLSWEMTKARAA